MSNTYDTIYNLVVLQDYKSLEKLKLQGFDFNILNTNNGHSLLYNTYLFAYENLTDLLRTKLLSFLIDCGCDETFCSAEHTILRCAIDNMDSSVVKMLLEKGSDPNSDFHLNNYDSDSSDAILNDIALAFNQMTETDITGKALKSYSSLYNTLFDYALEQYIIQVMDYLPFDVTVEYSFDFKISFFQRILNYYDFTALVQNAPELLDLTSLASLNYVMGFTDYLPIPSCAYLFYLRKAGAKTLNEKNMQMKYKIA
jgi:hypothetical protein